MLQVKLRMYKEYFRTIGLTFIVTVIFLSAFQQAASLAYNYRLRLWADQPTVNGTSSKPALKLGIFAALGITQGQNCKLCSRVSLELHDSTQPFFTLFWFQLILM